MTKRFAFIAGLPRSGSTLLSALLDQREDVYAPAISNTPNILEFADRGMQEDEAFKLGTNQNQRISLLRNALSAAYQFTDAPVVIDKSRLWGIPYYINLLTQVNEQRPKIIAPVRPLTQIVASFVRLCHGNSSNFIDAELDRSQITTTFRKCRDDARVEYLLQPNGHLGIAMLGLYSAFMDEYRDIFHLVTYSDLANNPKSVMRQIEEFLGLTPFDYDFYNVRGPIYNDSVLGMPGMHTLSKVVKPSNLDETQVLSAYALQRCALEDFWTEKLS